MLKSIFGLKEPIKHNLGYCKIYDTKHNNITCSKITLKIGSPTAYNCLIEYKHPNLFTVYKISNHSIYVQHVQPLSLFIDTSKTEYNRYLIIKIGSALDYIHKTFKKEHMNVGLESIFVEESGKVILGNFQNFRDYIDGSKDILMLADLCKNLLNMNLKDVDVVSPTILDMIFDI